MFFVYLKLFRFATRWEESEKVLIIFFSYVYIAEIRGGYFVCLYTSFEHVFFSTAAHMILLHHFLLFYDLNHTSGNPD